MQLRFIMTWEAILSHLRQHGVVVVPEVVDSVSLGELHRDAGMVATWEGRGSYELARNFTTVSSFRSVVSKVQAHVGPTAVGVPRSTPMMNAFWIERFAASPTSVFPETPDGMKLVSAHLVLDAGGRHGICYSRQGSVALRPTPLDAHEGDMIFIARPRLPGREQTPMRFVENPSAGQRVFSMFCTR